MYFVSSVSSVPESSQARRAAVFLYALRQDHLFTVAQPLCIVGHPRDRFTTSHLHFGVLVQPFVRSLHKLPAIHDTRHKGKGTLICIASHRTNP